MSKTQIVITLDRFPEIIAALPDLAQQAMQESAADIEGAAKANAPMDDGDLRDSIKARKESGEAWVVEVGQFYGLFVEYGTAGPYALGGKYKGASHPGLPARPFLTPAAEAERPEFIGEMKRLLDEL